MRPACLALAVLLLCSCTPSPQNADWSTYLGDPGRRHYSELVQINRDNVHELEVAWVYDSGEVDGRQFVVIAAGGGRRGPPSGSEYVAFSLPKRE